MKKMNEILKHYEDSFRIFGSLLHGAPSYAIMKAEKEGFP